MGNWRTVKIEGTLDPSDLQAARAFVNTGEDWDRFHCLSFYGQSLCGLGDWVATSMSAVGNLSERNYGVEDVAETLRQMVAEAPSLRLKVHCGGDWESTKCVATVTVADGEVTQGPPEVPTVGEGLSELGAFRLGQMLG